MGFCYTVTNCERHDFWLHIRGKLLTNFETIKCLTYWHKEGNWGNLALKNDENWSNFTKFNWTNLIEYHVFLLIGYENVAILSSKLSLDNLFHGQDQYRLRQCDLILILETQTVEEFTWEVKHHFKRLMKLYIYIYIYIFGSIFY